MPAIAKLAFPVGICLGEPITRLSAAVARRLPLRASSLMRWPPLRAPPVTTHRVALEARDDFRLKEAIAPCGTPSRTLNLTVRRLRLRTRTVKSVASPGATKRVRGVMAIESDCPDLARVGALAVAGDDDVPAVWATA